MLTSSNQYIRPEYLSPLPNTFDSKNSPLALLAQTCSAIGSDQPNPKLLANIEKSQKMSSSGGSKESGNSRDKLSPGSNSTLSNSSSSASDTPKSSFKPYEPNFREKNNSPNDERTKNRTPTNKSSLTVLSLTATQPAGPHILQNGRSESNQSAASLRGDSPANLSRKTPNGDVKSVNEKNNSPNNGMYRASSKESANEPKATDLSKDSNSSKISIPVPTSNATSTPNPYMSSFTTPGFPYSMDLMTASALQHQSMLKAAALSPYLNYARMKMPGGAESMMPVCRDPYCTGCALSPHMLGAGGKTGATGTCPAGCTQCDHPGKSPYPSLPTSAYAHAQLAALAAASQMPYVCNWIAGDSNYCGKRFATSEELFQHLRTTHTNGSMSESLINPAIAAAVASGIPPTHPLFQRAYPSAQLSSLASARYHPYSKPGLLPSSLTSSLAAGLSPGYPPSLAQYFSPYSLYGPRLGSSHPPL
uniref:CSON013549 protein n=1 Tax=Culicoides sonorensis TaxID=179676 RepID=A0A336MCL8_CULSO